MVMRKGTSKVLLAPSAVSQLSPELRLIYTVSEFAQGLTASEKEQFKKLQLQHEKLPPTASDVMKMTEELNQEGARRHAFWTPATGTRLGGFLGRIQKFAEAGDALIGGTQSLIVSGVWTALRVSLEAAVGHYAYFDQVSSLFMRLTQSWSITTEFVKHFPDSVDLQALFADYLTRVVRLCQQIVSVARRPSYLLLASSLFLTFDKEFGPIQEELNMYGTLIEKLFALLTSSQIVKAQQATKKETRGILQNISKSRKKQYIIEQKQQLLHRLSPRQAQQDAIWRRERKRGTASWILTSPEYNSWKLGLQPVLRVTGHLGCGKTVALATIMANASTGKATYAGFICKRDDPNTLEGLTILGSIAHQLVQSNMVRQQWEALIQRSPDTFLGFWTMSSILHLLQTLLPREANFHVIFDGLDDCAKEEVEMLLQALQDLRATHQISVCFSTREDASGLSAHLTHEYLGNAVTLSLNNAERDGEINEYIITEVQRRNDSRLPKLDEESVKGITTALTVGAQGMYLWVSLHLEAIFPSYNDGVVTDELVRGILHHLPKDLPQAFDQALGRISDRRYGDRIFQLVAAAAVVDTHLTGEELSVALTIQPGDPTWNATKLPRIPKQVVTRCGGGLLELDEEDNLVRFIHHSVQSHMYEQKAGMDGRKLPSGWLADANSFMGSVCVTYLNFGEFDRRIAPRQVIDPTQVSEKLKNEAACSNPIVASVVRHIKGDKKRKVTHEQLNIFPILLKAQTKDNEPMRCFYPYASKHWAQHTAQLSKEDATKIDKLWKALVHHRPPHISVPWNPSVGDEGGILEYAFAHSHEHLYRYVINDHLHDFGIITFASRFVVDGTPTTICFVKEPRIQLKWLMTMIEKCLVSVESPLITSGYYLALLYIYVTTQLRGQRTIEAGELQRRIRSHFMRNKQSELGQLSMQETYSAKMSLEDVTFRLWSLIEEAYTTSPTSTDTASAVLQIAVPVLRVLCSIMRSTTTLASIRESFFACLGVISRAANPEIFSGIWEYVCEEGLPGHQRNAGSLVPQLLDYACRHTDSDLARMVSINYHIEKSLFEHALERVKGEAGPIFRSRINRLMESTAHVIKRPSLEADTSLGRLEACLKKNQNDQARAMVGETLERCFNLRANDFPVKMVKLAIVYRRDTVLDGIPHLERVLEGWPTVLIDTMITFAAEAPAQTGEEAERERNIFFTLLGEVKKFKSHDLYITGFDNRHPQKLYSGWTALHAAALWQKYAVQALLTVPASTKLTTQQTRLGLTPLVVALCGRLGQNDISSVVDDLLHAESTLSGTWSLKPAHQDLPVSPLDCSIVIHPPHITQKLVGHSIKYSSGSPALMEDEKIQKYINIIALLENRILNWDEDWVWKVIVKQTTSPESYYKPTVRDRVRRDLAPKIQRARSFR